MGIHPTRFESFQVPVEIDGVRLQTILVARECGALGITLGLIAKLVVWDEDRASAIERSLRALSELELRGVPTTREAALEILASELELSARTWGLVLSGRTLLLGRRRHQAHGLALRQFECT